MLPSRSRIQTKRILQNPRSVALSSAPVLNKDKQRGSDEPKDKQVQETKPKSTKGSITHAQTAERNVYRPEIGSSYSDGAALSDQQQYTYVTDESGYTWLYDTLCGQYYYYDGTLGAYVLYNQQGNSSNGYNGAQFYGAATEASITAVQIQEDTVSVSTAKGDEHISEKKGKQHSNRRIVRMAGGQVWEDTTLDDWPTNDYRLFAGDLGPEVTSEMLQQAFGKFRTLQRTHVVADKKTGKSRGYGFLSFGDADDFLAAWKEFNGKYIGSRPIKLRKSTWKDRNADIRKVKRVDKRAFLDFKQGKK
ncbi:hypothetical protein GGI25_002450 [Coemansia spiralis]|uniref:RRM domain-containing protein n=2 Tax=Coemansia TaxID=4863 RepID=A0A9W8G886_9FUNG|nr:hypothetical protein EDC05_000987 [Coemansia umbellata]KAJ2624735.1 hypothetical protein GGI26_001151 [Coemansia sp. RSA 1358]KAJ2678278.1 hypothetical protein GGI25_002450 [Coemansia spiralis]